MKTFTVKEIAGQLGVSCGAIYKAVSNGSLKHYRIGAAIRISQQHFEDWLKQIEQEAPDSTVSQSFSHLDL